MGTNNTYEYTVHYKYYNGIGNNLVIKSNVALENFTLKDFACIDQQLRRENPLLIGIHAIKLVRTIHEKGENYGNK